MLGLIENSLSASGKIKNFVFVTCARKFHPPSTMFLCARNVRGVDIIVYLHMRISFQIFLVVCAIKSTYTVRNDQVKYTLDVNVVLTPPIISHQTSFVSWAEIYQ